MKYARSHVKKLTLQSQNFYARSLINTAFLYSKKLEAEKLAKHIIFPKD